jgi:hypothetical protein
VQVLVARELVHRFLHLWPFSHSSIYAAHSRCDVAPPPRSP